MKFHTDALKKLSRKMTLWAVIASPDSRQWIRAAKADLDKLELGANWSGGRKTKASNSPVRAYAQTILQNLLENRRVQIFFREHSKALELSGVQLKVPDWAMACAELPVFSRNPKNFNQWWWVAEAMLKDQCPDLVNRPEWGAITRQWVCRNKLGTLRSRTPRTRILDKIKDALWNLAPE